MKIILAVLVIVLANVMVSAQWKKGDEKVEDTSERKSVNGSADTSSSLKTQKALSKNGRNRRHPTTALP